MANTPNQGQQAFPVKGQRANTSSSMEHKARPNHPCLRQQPHSSHEQSKTGRQQSFICRNGQTWHEGCRLPTPGLNKESLHSPQPPHPRPGSKGKGGKEQINLQEQNRPIQTQRAARHPTGRLHCVPSANRSSGRSRPLTSSMKMCVNSTKLLALTIFCSRTPVVT